MIESLFAKTRRKILALFLLNSERQYYFSEVVRGTGIRQGAVQRELKSLVSSGILNAESRGRQIFYSANKANPIYEELRGIIYKTFAVGDVLAGVLQSFGKSIDAAFIYGSMARGDDTGRSDIDLFVIGKASFGDLSESISARESELGRPVNIFSLTAGEFAEKVKAKNHFVSSVMKSAKLYLIGSEDDLGRMAKKQVAKKGTVKRRGNRRPARTG